MPSNGTTLSEYLLQVQVASSRFQFLEEALKMYLGECYRQIALTLGNRVPFKYSYSDVADLPLGSLVRLFEKHSDNEEVVQLLREVPKERNYVAHRAYLLAVDEIHDPRKIALEFERVTIIAEKADRAVKAIAQEVRSVESLRKELEKLG